MNILITSHFFSPSVGGIESISEMLASYFTRSGHNVRLITSTLAESSNYDTRYEFEIIRKPKKRVLFNSFLWSDIVFQNNIEIGSLWPLLVVNRPLVIGLQTWIRKPDGNRSIVQYFKLAVLRFSSQVIACSKAIRDDSYKSAMVIGNPYNNQVFYTNNDTKIHNSIVFLGRLVSDKGVCLLLEAFALLPPSSCKLTIIGSGPEEPSLRKFVMDNSLSDSVTFLGPLKGHELASVLNRHQILVVPSRWREPFGIVALEGLACGCVVIAANEGGLPDAVGNAGVIFQRDSLVDLFSKLRDVINNPLLQDQLRKNAHDHLCQFRSDFICQKYLDVLECVRRRS